METQSITTWYADKALWAAFFAIAAPIASKYLGQSFDPAQYTALAAIVGMYIAAHKAKSYGILKAEIAVRASSPQNAVPAPT